MEESMPDPSFLTALAALLTAIVALSGELRRWFRKPDREDK
jgi:hypothetical protein